MPRLIVVVLALWSATAVAGPSGRVIRVERTAGSANAVPRLCELSGDTGTCFGEEPKIGQTLVVLDEHRLVAELQIVEASGLLVSCANLWMVKVRPVRGSATDGDGFGVSDPNLNPNRAHLIEKHHRPAAPSGLAGEEVWRAIDRDGDGNADAMLTRYSCDGSGRPLPGGSAHCIDVWARIAGRVVRTTQINLAQCNL